MPTPRRCETLALALVARSRPRWRGETRMSGMYLEDFAVGQVFRSARVKVDGLRIKSFAAEFDPQPFHLDDDAARQSIFGGLAASGA